MKSIYNVQISNNNDSCSVNTYNLVSNKIFGKLICKWHCVPLQPLVHAARCTGIVTWWHTYIVVDGGHCTLSSYTPLKRCALYDKHGMRFQYSFHPFDVMFYLWIFRKIIKSKNRCTTTTTTTTKQSPMRPNSIVYWTLSGEWWTMAKWRFIIMTSKWTVNIHMNASE